MLAIPLKSLPTSVLRLKISPPSHGYDAPYPTDYRTVADLIPPIPAPPLDHGGGIGDRRRQKGSPEPLAPQGRQRRLVHAGLGVQRWPDAGLGCTPAAELPASKEVSGYVVVVVHRATYGMETDRTFEAHVGGGRALYCNGP